MTSAPESQPIGHPNTAGDVAGGEQRPPGDRYSIIARLGLLASRFWMVTAAIWLVVVGIGVYAFFGGLAREGFPPVNIPIVVVDGAYFVDDAEVVDTDVAVPLAEAYRGVEGVAEVTTIALPSAFATIVEFEADYSSPEGAALLQPATDATALPAEAAVQVRSIDATKFVEVYDILVAISGPADASAADLEAQAEPLRAYLAETAGVVRADTRNLVTEGLDPATGEAVARQTRFTRTFFQGDAGFAPAVSIGLVRDPDNSELDILGFSDAVEKRLQSEEAPQLEAGYEAAVTADFASDIRTQTNSLIGNLATGLVAVAIVSLVLIGWRASVVTALFMITVVFAAMAMMMVMGLTLNTITLFGLILTIGLLVDDAIVIGESIDATRAEGVGGGEERILGVALNRVAIASLAGTLTTVLVFGPMLFIGGILGEFIRAIPLTVILTLLLSYLFSVIFIPAIGRFVLLRGNPSANPVRRAERGLATRVARLASFPARGGVAGWGTGVLLASLPILALVGAGAIAGGLGFNIFPKSKDANVLYIATDFAPGTTLEQAETIADEIDAVTVDVLGDDLVLAQYVRGNERGAETYIDLTPFDERSTRAPIYRDRLEDGLEGIAGARITVSVLDAGPPVEEFPFAVQIAATDGNVDGARNLADDLLASLPGSELDNGSTVVQVIESTAGQVTRIDGERYVEVRANFDNDDLTANTTAAQDLVESRYGSDELAAFGLPADALGFDFGQESENQEDFAALGSALLGALGLMLVLLVVQFRSLLQPLLVFLAIPFSLLGVTVALAATDNGISFFSAVGFIALLGVVVNNTILLVDSANQARREGLTIHDAIGQAVERRFRPLIATTITTVVGLLPLALSDPFWEGLSFTLMGGLVSSTLLVLFSFPVFYIAAMKTRQKLGNAGRRLVGRPAA